MSSYLDVPVLPPPPGKASNFDNPRSRGPATIALCSVCLALMWPIVLLRIYFKAWVKRSFGWDDASTILAVIGVTSYAATVIWAMKTLGPHGWDVRATSLTEQTTKITVIVWLLLYGPTMFLAKLALFLLFLRIFSSDRPTKVATYLGIVINCLYYIAITLTYGIRCVRRPGQSWSAGYSTAGCGTTTVLNFIQGSFGIVSDLYIFILPLPVLWSLHMATRQKLAVCSVFLTGLVGVLASISGLYYRIVEARNPDFTWTEPPTLALAVVEMSVGVICGSLPCLPSLIRQHSLKFSHIFSTIYLICRGHKTKSERSSDLPIHEFGRIVSDLSLPRLVPVETRDLGAMQGNSELLKSGDYHEDGNTSHGSSSEP